MKYLVDDEVFYDIDEVLNYCISEDYHEDDDDFEEWVNDTYGSIEIAGDTYYAYDILDNACDSNMNYLLRNFKEERNDSDREEARYELEKANPGDYIECQNYTIQVMEDDDIECQLDIIDDVRQYLIDQKIIQEQRRAEETKDENDIMSLFQVIS